MVLCSSALQMKPSVLAQLLCLLLLILSSSLLMSTVGLGGDSTLKKVATAEDSTKNISSEVVNTQNQSASSGFNAAPDSNPSSLNYSTEKANSTETAPDSKVEHPKPNLTKSDGTQKLQSSNNTTIASLSPAEQSSAAPPATQQHVSTSHQPVLATTSSSTPFAHTESSKSPAPSTTAPPVTNMQKQTILTPEISAVTTPLKYTKPTETTSTYITITEEQTHPPATPGAITVSKSTSTTMSPSLNDTALLSTRKPTIQASNTQPADILIRNTSSASYRKSSASATRVSMVEAAGGALTRQLVDTASLMAVLLFGLLFFLVTVAVLITQAYESYRRKDYTQVDYLINGMYIDSGV